MDEIKKPLRPSAIPILAPKQSMRPLTDRTNRNLPTTKKIAAEERQKICAAHFLRHWKLRRNLRGRKSQWTLQNARGQQSAKKSKCCTRHHAKNAFLPRPKF